MIRSMSYVFTSQSIAGQTARNRPSFRSAGLRFAVMAISAGKTGNDQHAFIGREHGIVGRPGFALPRLLVSTIGLGFPVVPEVKKIAWTSPVGRLPHLPRPRTWPGRQPTVLEQDVGAAVERRAAALVDQHVGADLRRCSNSCLEAGTTLNPARMRPRLATSMARHCRSRPRSAGYDPNGAREMVGGGFHRLCQRAVGDNSLGSE